MSVFAGPSMVENGLVFAYDMNNTDKSWKGAPTTNLYQDTFGATGTLDGFGGGSFLDTTLSVQNPFNTGIVYARKSNAGVATWSVQANLTAGVTYTYSIWCNPVGSTSISMRRNEPSVYVAESKIVSVTPGVWTRVSFTFTVSVGKTGSQVVGIGVGDVNVGGDNRGIYLYGAMLEQQSFATPYTNTSRSSTQAILDLTRNNTITATSLTYNSNNTFRFAGSDSIATTYVPINTAGSISVWFKINAHKDYNTIFDNALGANDWEFWVYSTGVARFRSTADNGDYILDSDVLLTGIYYNFVITWTSTTATLYKNGVFMSQDTTVGTKVTPGVMYFGGGNAGNTKLDGELPCAFVYNTALTPAEVKQNFNALRGRFGV